MDFLRDVDIGTVVIQFAVLLFSLSIHEASHAWVADLHGDPTARRLGRVTLNPVAHIDPIGTLLFPLLQLIAGFPVIGWAKPVPVDGSRLRNPARDQVLVSLAGPGSNLLAAGCAFAGLVLLRLISPDARALILNMAVTMSIPRQESLLAPFVGMLFFLLVINLALALFNAIPIPPLDGHWLLYRFLPYNAGRMLMRYSGYGFLLLYALLFLGAFRIIWWPIGWVLGRLI